MSQSFESVAPAKRFLLLPASGEWFRVGDAPAVSLRRRPSLRLLLLSLLELRRTSGEVLSVREAFARGWPGERATTKAADMRVYTAMCTLRRLGLRGFVLNRADGYLLIGEVCVVEEEASGPTLGAGASDEALDALAS